MAMEYMFGLMETDMKENGEGKEFKHIILDASSMAVEGSYTNAKKLIKKINIC